MSNVLTGRKKKRKVKRRIHREEKRQETEDGEHSALEARPCSALHTAKTGTAAWGLKVCPQPRLVSKEHKASSVPESFGQNEGSIRSWKGFQQKEHKPVPQSNTTVNGPPGSPMKAYTRWLLALQDWSRPQQKKEKATIHLRPVKRDTTASGRSNNETLQRPAEVITPVVCVW